MPKSLAFSSRMRSILAAAALIDRMREGNARLFGVQDVTLDAVRESRNSQ